MNYAILLACSDLLDPRDRAVAAWLDKQVDKLIDSKPRVVLMADKTEGDRYLLRELAHREARVYMYHAYGARQEFVGTKRASTVIWVGRCADLAMVRDLKQAQKIGWEVYALTLIRRCGEFDESLKPLETFLDWYKPIAGNPEEYEAT